MDDLAWCRTGDHLVFLDIGRDRYFRLGRESEQAFLEGTARNDGSDWHQPLSFPRPDGWSSAGDTSRSIGEGAFELTKVARALWTQRRIERRIAVAGLHPVLQDFARAMSRCTKSDAHLSAEGASMVRAFEHARLLRTAADRCLARSIALAGCLAATGDRCHVVLGVTSPPFSAHCWAQHGTAVLNDTLEEVQRYTPILVV